MRIDLERSFDAADRHLRQLRADVDHQDRLAALGTAAALIIHEFRNLLTPLRAYAQMAAANPEDRVLADKVIARAALCAEQASAIADTILEFSKPEAVSTIEEAELSADVEACLTKAVTLLGRPLASDRIKLVSKIHGGLAARIRPVALQHVLMNLILNSRAALAGRGGQITVCAAPAGSQVSITLSDDGPGMTLEARDAIKPFVGGGCGLGLAVCNRLVTDAGGTIQIQSPGSGTRVQMLLPSAQNAALATEQRPIDYQPARAPHLAG